MAGGRGSPIVGISGEGGVRGAVDRPAGRSAQPCQSPVNVDGPRGPWTPRPPSPSSCGGPWSFNVDGPLGAVDTLRRPPPAPRRPRRTAFNVDGPLGAVDTRAAGGWSCRRAAFNVDGPLGAVDTGARRLADAVGAGPSTWTARSGPWTRQLNRRNAAVDAVELPSEGCVVPLWGISSWGTSRGFYGRLGFPTCPPPCLVRCSGGATLPPHNLRGVMSVGRSRGGFRGLRAPRGELARVLPRT